MNIWLPLPKSLSCDNILLVVFLTLSAIYMLSESGDLIIRCIALGCIGWAVWISLNMLKLLRLHVAGKDSSTT